MAGIAWVTVTGDDIRKVLSLEVEQAANENTGADVVAGTAFDSEAANRRDDIVEMVVAEVRGAIKQGGITPLSLTAGTIPPVLKAHALYIAAWRLAMSVPNLKMIILSEAGVSAPFAKFREAAEAMLERVRSGKINVDYPTDPEVDEDGNVIPRPVSWGDVQGTSVLGTAGGFDMTTD